MHAYRSQPSSRNPTRPRIASDIFLPVLASDWIDNDPAPSQIILLGSQAQNVTYSCCISTVMIGTAQNYVSLSLHV